MKKIIAFILILSCSFSSNAQLEGMEIGVDGSFWASNWGGSGNIGIKYGLQLNETFVIGPSIRYQRWWSSHPQMAQKASANIFGAGVYLHARFAKWIYLGAEFEYLQSPTQPYVEGKRRGWVPVLFLAGGLSKQLNDRFRLNIGLNYDLINSQYTPFANEYVITRKNGSKIPLIYRLALFINI